MNSHFISQSVESMHYAIIRLRELLISLLIILPVKAVTRA